MAGRGSRAQSTPTAQVVLVKRVGVSVTAILQANDTSNAVEKASDLVRHLYERYSQLEKNKNAKKDKDALANALAGDAWLAGIDGLPEKMQEWLLGDRESITGK